MLISVVTAFEEFRFLNLRSHHPVEVAVLRNILSVRNVDDGDEEGFLIGDIRNMVHACNKYGTGVYKSL